MNWWILVTMMLVAILAVTWAAWIEGHPDADPSPPRVEGPPSDVSE